MARKKDETEPTEEIATPVAQGPRFLIHTPLNPGFNGIRCGVKFSEGTGSTNDAAAAAHCRELGYRVNDAQPTEE